MFSWFMSLIERYIPDNIKAGDIDQLRRAKLVSGLFIVTATLGIPFAVLYYILGDLISAYAVIAGVSFGPIIIYILQKTGSTFIASSVGMFALFIPLSIMGIVMGGITSPPLLWYAWAPILAMSLMGRKPAIIWTVICCSALIIFYIADVTGFEFQNDLTHNQFTLIYLACLLGLILLMFSFAYLYESFKDYALEQMRKSESDYKSLYETSLVGLFRVRISDKKIIKANMTAAKIIGYDSPDEIIEKVFAYEGFSQEKSTEFMNELTKHDSVSDFEIPYGRHDSKDITISFSAVSYPENGYVEGSMIDITDRKKAEAELASAQQELIEKAHQAGMADIVIGTLHNVGNILNSITTSAEVMNNIIKTSNVASLKKANDLIRENRDNFEEFISNDPKGKKLAEYYLAIEEAIFNEHKEVKKHLSRLNNKVNTITEVILSQESYAGASSLTEAYQLTGIIDDALAMQAASLETSNITVIRDYNHVPKIMIQKSKLIHIFFNLINNAKDAMLNIPLEARQLTISVNKDDKAVFARISDMGHGISKQNIERIFSHGFTTKNIGHGFGLHSCANYMTEMGGRMWAESQGEGKGATMVLRFQLA